MVTSQVIGAETVLDTPPPVGTIHAIKGWLIINCCQKISVEREPRPGYPVTINSALLCGLLILYNFAQLLDSPVPDGVELRSEPYNL